MTEFKKLGYRLAAIASVALPMSVISAVAMAGQKPGAGALTDGTQGGQSLGGWFVRLAGDLSNIMPLLNFAFYAISVVFLLLGITGLKKATEQGGGGGMMPHIAKLFIAGLAAAAPAVLGWVLATYGEGTDSSLEATAGWTKGAYEYEYTGN